VGSEIKSAHWRQSRRRVEKMSGHFGGGEWPEGGHNPLELVIGLADDTERSFRLMGFVAAQSIRPDVSMRRGRKVKAGGV
jgi:hypothetical protein